MENFLYKRGFVITNKDPLEDKKGILQKLNWRNIKIGEYNVIFDGNLNINSSSLAGTDILVVGTVLDPFNNLINSDDITEKLAQKFNDSTEDFFDYLDRLSGRFILLLKSKTKTFILQDATGTRSVFYTWQSNFVFISSHAELLADLNCYKPSDEANRFKSSIQFRDNKDSYFPGISTPYEEIKMLTPNTLLNLSAREVERFFPRENLENQEINNELIGELSDFFQSQVDLLRKDYSLSLSLTAGLDSRLSLATSKKHKDHIYFYTLTYGKNSEKDAEVARDICDELNLTHHIIPTKGKIDDGFMDLFLKNTSNMSSEFRGEIGEALYYNYPQGCLHIKSNGSEICRGYYRDIYAILPNKILGEVYAKLYGINPQSSFVRESFEEFIEVTKLNKESIYNYDHYDLFYWEHRIGNWQSLCLYEWDIAQDTFIPFNNRYILTKMLSIPLKDRLSGRLYYDIIKKVWPETLTIPINPFNRKAKLKKVKRIKKGLQFRMKYS
jgi:hypothetical protein